MEVNAAVIMSVMELRGMDSLRVAGSPLALISRIRLWGSNPREKDVLFVARCDEGAAIQAGKQRHVVLTCGNADVSSQMLLAAANDALIDVHAWDAALKDSVFAGSSLDVLAELGARMIPHPFVVYDPNLVAIASSPGYWEGEPQVGGVNRIPSDAAHNLIMDDEYHQAAERREPFYYVDDRQQLVYCINVFRKGAYAARFVLNVERDAAGLSQGEELLAQHFVRSVSAALDFALDTKEMLHETFLTDALRAVLQGSSAEGEEHLSRAFFERGWMASDCLQVIRAAFHAGVQWEGAADFLCHTLERRFAPSVAVTFEGEIVWLINLSLYARQASCAPLAAQAAAGSMLTDLCGSYACKAGESRQFSGFRQVKAGYDEAGIALTVGFQENPELWHYRFADYVMPYLMRKATEELTPRQLCHPALETLLYYDEAQGTALAKTLITYLRCGQSMVHAAQELGIHRTSLQRRLDRIRTLVNMRSNDPQETVHLLFSALLLKM